MPAYHLDFLNKNMYRKYPFRASSTHVFTNSQVLPQELIVSAQISAPYTYRKIYVSKVYAKNRFVSVVINDYATDIALGAFSGKITSQFQTLTLEPYVSTVSGKLVIGALSALDSVYGGNFFAKDDGLLEDSVIFCYTPPAVTAFTHEGSEIRGHIAIVPDNITVSTDTEQVLLSIINVDLIASNNDFHGDLNNCPTPLIRGINTVSPDINGNIDIYGILPVTIDVGTAEVELVPGVTIDEVCPERLKIYPPDNTSDVYYTDILTATETEWKTWPNFS